MPLRSHTPETRDAAMRRLRWLARFLDHAISIPGTKVTVGYDAVIGLIPVVGDAVTAAAGLYIVNEARRLGASNRTLAMMLGNVALDFLIGEVPVLGDLGDAFFKAHARNLRLLEADLAAAAGRESVPTEEAADGTAQRRRVENVAA